ncbi:MAG: HAMP domain-containing histidine kinase [Oscillospiraceae bacterium]|jgi:signal transduction histidine kinase|nr:HAMP domain-containing histidine kinase [Oscillospiraceae bacterium]
MRPRSGIKSILSRVQFKFALVFLILIAGLLVMLNTYPTVVTRDLVFASKKSSLENQAGVISATLSVSESLTTDSVGKAMDFLDLRTLGRVIITDAQARVLYDSSEFDYSPGRLALFSEISSALAGQVVCYCVYDGEAFISSEAMPIMRAGVAIGAVYLYEYDSSQAALISATQRNLRNISVVFGLLAVAFTMLFSRALTTRITDLVRATRIVSGGDYDYKIPVRGSDELSELGAEFNNFTGRLKETEELRRRFVSDASHELKTPLASIRLLSDSIVNAEYMDKETMVEFVTDIGTEAERLGRTAEKLLSLSKLDSAAGFDFTELDMKTIVEKTLHILEPLAKERSVRLTTEADEGCAVMGNEDLLYRIVFNLAENSIKYNVADGEVKISLSCNPEAVSLIVEDTGIGIPEADLPHIFDRFYRVDKARARDAGGSGLGLSIVHDAVLLHGGQISVERREGGGTRVTITFPSYSQWEVQS